MTYSIVTYGVKRDAKLMISPKEEKRDGLTGGKKLADNKLQSVQIRLAGMYCRRNESTKSKVNWRRHGK